MCLGERQGVGMHKRFGSCHHAALLCALGALLFASPAPSGASPAKEKETEKQEKSEKPSRQEIRRQKAIQKEQESAYKKWLEEEVPYVITDQERASFKKLSTDDEREQFI